MKIILINPPFIRKAVREGRCEQRADSYQYLMVPISLPSTAAMFQKKHDVKILDCIADDISFQKLAEILRKEKPQIVFVNVATFSFSSDIAVSRICKKLGIKSAAIGVHVTSLPIETLEKSDFDFVVKGEPELVSLKLVEALEKKKNLKAIPGLAFRKNGKIVNNKECAFIKNLDSLPFPARELIPNEKYLMPLYHEPYTLLIPSRGCPFNCIFCTAHKYYGKNQRYRSIKNIIAEVKEIVFENNIHHIGIWSDNFTLNKKFVIDFCRALKKEKLEKQVDWYCNSRVDALDDEMVKEMSSAGCKVMTFGVESLDPQILKNIRKGITKQQVENTVRLCRKYKIQSQVHIIFGLPGENKETAKNTVKDILKINPDYVQFYCAIPFPGTEFYQYADKNNLITTKDWSKYEINRAIISYPNFSDRELQRTMRNAYLRFYFRPAYMIQVLKGFSLKKWPSLAYQAFSFVKGWVFSSD